MSLKKMTGFLMKICSYAPYLGIIPKACNLNRESGISALVTLRDEPWIEPSLLSIKDFVDEIVIVDSSTGDRPRKVKRIAKELSRAHGLDVKYTHTKPNLLKQTEIVTRMSTREWLLRWDGDFIAYLSGKRDIKRLKGVIGKLPKEKYYFIEFSVLDVDLGLLHTRKQPYHPTVHLFKYSPFLVERPYPRALRRYIRRALRKQLPTRIPYLPYPYWYERIPLHQVFVMHLRSVKSPLRLLEGRYENYWALLKPDEKEKYSNSFEKYVEYHVKRDFNEGVEEAAQTYTQDLVKKWNLVPFSTEVYGDYPIVLKRWIRENLGVEIGQTEEFRNKLMRYLLSF